MPEWLGKAIRNVRIEKLLARGGTAEVYVGTHLNLERSVTVKVLHSYIEEEPLLLQRFQREAKVVAALRHPNIIQIFDFDTIDGHPYIVMEYVRGPTLAMYLRHLHQRKKRLPFDQIAHLLQGLAAALDYAHGQGVIHRDIKPANILLHTKAGEIPLDKPLPEDVEAIVTDFGLVRMVDAATHTTSGIVSGTPVYMSPEQSLGDPIDYRTDIYSLGIMLYEMLAGKVPFAADNTVTILHMQVHAAPPAISGIPAAMQAVVDRALRKNPDERYQTCQGMASDFTRSIGMNGQAETVPEPSPVPLVPVDPRIGGSDIGSSIPEPRIERRSLKLVRSRAWIGVGLFSVALLSLLGAWALGLVPVPGQQPSKATATLGALIMNTAVNMPASATLSPISPTSTLVGMSPTATLAGSIISSDKDGMIELNVPAGGFPMGSADGNPDEKPVHTVSLGAFRIDQTEVTNGMYAKCVQAGYCAVPSMTSSATHDRYYGITEFDRYPVIYVSWKDADNYCSWAGRRLPTEAEWEKAARGTDLRTYPWGNTPPSSQLLNSNGAVGDTTEVGKYPAGASPYGALDMAGNAWEWVADWYDAQYYTALGKNASNPPGPLAGRYHVLRGGSWANENDFARSSFRGGNFPAYLQASIGFRCAMNATP